MKWPFVTRRRFNKVRRRKKDLKAELAAVRLERDELARRLQYPGPQPAAETAEPEETAAPEGFTTPMDRTLMRFDEARNKGPIPAKFRVRTN